jgi:hypothetical protein
MDHKRTSLAKHRKASLTTFHSILRASKSIETLHSIQHLSITQHIDSTTQHVFSLGCPRQHHSITQHTGSITQHVFLGALANTTDSSSSQESKDMNAGTLMSTTSRSTEIASFSTRVHSYSTEITLLWSHETPRIGASYST